MPTAPAPSEPDTGAGDGSGSSSSAETPRVVRYASAGSIPFPIRRHICAIEDVWKEWTVGWEGTPSIESLIQIHGKPWYAGDEYHGHFYPRQRLVHIIREAVKNGAVASAEEAIVILEGIRGQRQPTSVCTSQPLRDLVVAWRVGKMAT